MAAPAILRAQSRHRSRSAPLWRLLPATGFGRPYLPDSTAERDRGLNSIGQPTGEGLAGCSCNRRPRRARRRRIGLDDGAGGGISRGPERRFVGRTPKPGCACPNRANLPEHFVHAYDDGRFLRHRRGELRTSRLVNQYRYLSRSLRPPGRPCGSSANRAKRLGLLALASISFLSGDYRGRPISAARRSSPTEDGRHAGVAEASRERGANNVRLWYRDEGPVSRQGAWNPARFPMGQYYHDVTGPRRPPTGQPVAFELSRRKGACSIPAPGCCSSASDAIDRAQIFHRLHGPDRRSRPSSRASSAPRRPCTGNLEPIFSFFGNRG